MVSKYSNSNETQRIATINYNTAKECEECGNYKKAVILYNINIKKYNDSDSMVALAQLYLNRKAGKIDNELARKLLEKAHNQENKSANQLLAYVWANGIGGPKNIQPAISLFYEELNNNNPDPMIYIELAELLPKNEKNKKVKKNLKNAVSKFETKLYKRNRSINKFNNTLLGRIVNTIPNFFYRKLENFYQKRNTERISYGLSDVYDKALDLYKYGDYEEAIVIFERLSNGGDKDASLRLADMTYNGLGCEQNVEKAKSLYEGILNQREKKLVDINYKIQKKIRKLEKIKAKAKQSRRDKRYIADIKEEIEFFRYKQSKIELNDTYNDALLNYGILLASNYQNENELAASVEYLKRFADQGELVPSKNAKLTKEGKRQNVRARKAMHKLGWLYDTNQWNPENLDEERKVFLKYSSGKMGMYASYIADKMHVQQNDIDDEITEKSSLKFENQKKCKIRYELGTLLATLHINNLARKVFNSMNAKGDYRCSGILAELEQKGKGGPKDLTSSIKHYREFIQCLNSNVDEELESQKYFALSKLASAMIETEDYIGAIPLLTISAKQGVKSAKKTLNELYEQGKWNPENEAEARLIKKRAIIKPISRVEPRRPVIIQTQNPAPIKHRTKQAIAASIAAATVAASANHYIKPAHSEIIISDKPRIQEVIKRNTNVEIDIPIISNDDNGIDTPKTFVIGDKILLNKNNSSCTIIGIVGYNSEKKKVYNVDESNINNFGLTAEQYLESLHQKENESEQNINLLYCVKDSEGKIDWLDLGKVQSTLLKPYRTVAKEEFEQDI